MTKEIRLILADDHPIVRQGLRQIIEIDPFLTIVAEAGDGAEALRIIAEHKPYVAVLDIDMPMLDGFSVARAIIDRKLPIEIVFLTMHSEEPIFRTAMDLGVRG